MYVELLCEVALAGGVKRAELIGASKPHAGCQEWDAVVRIEQGYELFHIHASKVTLIELPIPCDIISKTMVEALRLSGMKVELRPWRD